MAQLSAADVQTIVGQAVTRAVSISPNSVIAVTDREGYVLGVWTVRGGEPTAPQIASAVSKAGTAAFLSSNQNAFTSRTAGFIIQQHFPPGVINTAPGPLVGVGLSNLFFSDINKFKKTSIPPPGSIPLFNAKPGLAIIPVPATSLDGAPGGVPLYKNGQLVGGIGVTGDGTPPPIPGFRIENPLIFVDGYDKDEDVALAGQHRFQPSSSITADNVYINGLALPYVESSTQVSNVIVLSGNASATYPVQGAPMAFSYPVETFGGVQGEVRQPITSDPLPGTVNGQARLNETEVRSIINYAAARARTTRAGIRLPIGTHMEVFITVVNNPNQSGVAPTVLGTFRTGEATMFSWDVAVQKARTALYYSSRDLLGFGRNIAMSTRTVGFLAQSHYPPGIDADHAGPFFGQQEMFTCLSGTLANVSPISGCSPDPNLPNGITIFPGGFPLYRNGVLIGAIGISGDGVDQDDIVGASGTHDFLAPDSIRADQFVFRGARLPYAKFPRDPAGANGVNEVVTQAPGTTSLYDFNQDGKPDYVLYNAGTRQTAVWYMNNNVLLSGAYAPTLPAGWMLVDVADFNSDGHPDYALFNPNTRQTAIWYLNNRVYAGGGYGPSLPSGWQLVAVGDFNRDGHPDYALFNPSTRQTAIWYLNNNVLVGGAYGPTLPSGWQLVAVGDLNGDGNPDDMLYNPSTRQTAIWYLNNNVHRGGVYGPTLPLGWTLIGAADFNGDGNPDYVLFNPSTRQTAIWYLNIYNVYIGGAYGPTLAAGWSLVRP